MNGCCLDVICVEHAQQQTLKVSPFVLRFNQKAQHKQLVHVFITSDPKNENKWIPVTEMVLENNTLVPHFAKLDGKSSDSSSLVITPSLSMMDKSKSKKESLKQHLQKKIGTNRPDFLSPIQTNSLSNSSSETELNEEEEDDFSVTPLSPQSAMFVRDLVKDDWQSSTSTTPSTPSTSLAKKQQQESMRFKRAMKRLKSTDLTHAMQISDDKLLKINRLMNTSTVTDTSSSSSSSIPSTPSSAALSQLGWKDRWLESISKEIGYSYDDLTPSKEDSQLLYGVLKELSRKVDKMYIVFSTRLSNQNSTLTSFWTKNTNANLFEKKQVTIGRIFLWNSESKVIISDVDGTITKSDIMGHFWSNLGYDYSHANVASLFSKIEHNGYKILYLTARPFTMTQSTRTYIENIKQGDCKMPDGPLLCSPNTLNNAMLREVVFRKPEAFKMSILEVIGKLFQSAEEEKEQQKDATASTEIEESKSVRFQIPAKETNALEEAIKVEREEKEVQLKQTEISHAIVNKGPFVAGFGNRESDCSSYYHVGIPKHLSFRINASGQVKVHATNETFTSYHQIEEHIQEFFPLRHELLKMEKEDALAKKEAQE